MANDGFIPASEREYREEGWCPACHNTGIGVTGDPSDRCGYCPERFKIVELLDHALAADLRIAELEAERDAYKTTLQLRGVRIVQVELEHPDTAHLTEARSLIDELDNYADQAQIIVRESPRTDAIILHGMGKRLLAKVEAYRKDTT